MTDIPFPARRRRVCAPAPWDCHEEAETPPELEELLEAFRALRSRKAEAPSDLDAAIEVGFADVDGVLAELDVGAGLTLEHLDHVTSTAIRHGAGIYNHGPLGRVACGRIYFRAAHGLCEVQATETPALEPETEIAIGWLREIVDDTEEVTEDNGEVVAWRLRHAFDSLGIAPECATITGLMRELAAEVGGLLLVGKLVERVVERADDLAHVPQVAAFLVRHSVRTCLSLAEEDAFHDPFPSLAAGAFSEIAEDCESIDLQFLMREGTDELKRDVRAVCAGSLSAK